MPIRKILTVVLLLPSFASAQNGQRDVWEPFRYFVGSWEGTGNGQPGVSKTQREYKFVLNGKFLHAHNRSSYEPQAKNPKGELHEDWGLLGFDKSRKQFVTKHPFFKFVSVCSFHSLTRFTNVIVQTPSTKTQ